MQLEMDFGDTKRCCRCKETKDASEYHKDKGMKDGLYSWCKSCAKANTRKRKAHFVASPPPIPVTKQCNKCKETKVSSEFGKDRGSVDGLYHKCKGCGNAIGKLNRAMQTRRNTLTGPPDRTGTKKCNDCGETKQKTEW